MKGLTYIIRGELERDRLIKAIRSLPLNTVVRIMPEGRSLSQNDKMWALFTEISRDKPQGRDFPPEVWKNIFMSAYGIECRFVPGLEGEPVPVGYRSSHFSKQGMSDFLEFSEATAAFLKEKKHDHPKDK